MKKALIASLLFGTAAAFASAPLTAQEPALLRVRPPVGQVSHYLTTRRSVQQSSAMATADSVTTSCELSTETVTAADGDIRTLASRSDSMVYDGPNAAFVIQMARRVGTMPTMMRRDARLRPLPMTEARGAPENALSQLAGLMRGGHGGLLPERAVRAGDSWRDSSENVFSVGQQRVTLRSRGTYRLVRLEQQAGTRTAVIATNVTLESSGERNGDAGPPPGMGSLTMEMESVVDLDRGRWVRQSTSTTSRGTAGGASLSAHSISTTTLLPDSAAPSFSGDTMCEAAGRRSAARGPSATDTMMAAIVEGAGWEVLRSDARRLKAAQDAYLAGHHTYATHLDSLGFRPSPMVTIRIGVATATAWSASISVLGTTASCGLYFGMVIPTGERMCRVPPP